MDVCPSFRKVAFAPTSPKEALFTRLRCKQWSCDVCACLNAKMWRGFLAHTLPLISDSWQFLTLTAPAHKRSKAASLFVFRDNIERLMKRIKRAVGEVEYVRVYEQHEKGAIHAHLIITGLTPFVVFGYSIRHVKQWFGVLTRSRHNCWSTQSWLKKIAQECQMGYILDLQFIQKGEFGHVIWYITKYLTKAQQNLEVKGLRHVQTSRGIGSPQPQNTLVWQVGSYLAANMLPAGTKTLDLNTGFMIDNNYWEQDMVYPPN